MNNLSLRKIVMMLFLLFFTRVSFAQDPHFSQFSASPMTLNPALTGMMPGNMRFASNFRSQWGTVSNAFYTGTAAFDMKYTPFNYDNEYQDVFGIGLMAMMDQSNNGALKANYITGSIAYNKLLQRDGNWYLGGGFQYTITHKALDYSKLTFGQQLTPYGYDINIPNGEPKGGFDLYYTDMHAGIMLSGKSDGEDPEYTWCLGSSLYHLSRPNESLTGQDNRVPQRFTIHGNYTHLTDYNGNITFSGLYMNSYKEEYMVGAVFSKKIKESYSDGNTDIGLGENLELGVWYRLRDAIIPYVGLQLEGWKFGLSYDVNTSGLSSASYYQGGVEFSLIYNFMVDPNLRIASKALCPRPHKSHLKWYGY